MRAAAGMGTKYENGVCFTSGIFRFGSLEKKRVAKKLLSEVCVFKVTL